MLADARPQNRKPPRPIRWNTLRILRAEHNADVSRSFVAVEWHDSDRFPGTITLHQRARSNTKCNILGRQCCMGNIYTPLSLEERTMLPPQLERGLNPAASASGLNRSASTRARELRRNGWTRPATRRGPGRPPVAGGSRAAAAQMRDRKSVV